MFFFLFSIPPILFRSFLSYLPFISLLNPTVLFSGGNASDKEFEESLPSERSPSRGRGAPGRSSGGPQLRPCAAEAAGARRREGGRGAALYPLRSFPHLFRFSIFFSFLDSSC